jgi:putative FmdB family regulatory protein
MGLAYSDKIPGLKTLSPRIHNFDGLVILTLIIISKYQYPDFFYGGPMPNYPYRCLDCKKRFEIFMSYSEYGTRPVSCPHCSSQNVQRRISRIRFARSEESRMENLSDMDDFDGLEDDPRALGKMMRKMSREMGEEMGPEFDEVIDRLEAGQSPEDIESTMPDLGGGPDAGGDLDDF